MQSDILLKMMGLALSAAKFMTGASVIEYKNQPQNYVTDTDKKVEAFLKTELLKLIPSSSFLGEETGISGNESGYLWVVDPVDGTANYVRNLEFSAISIGLSYNGEIIKGVVYNPFHDKLYSAEKGGGAFLNGNKISVSDSDFSHSLLCTALCVYKKELSPLCEKVISKIYNGCSDLRRFGTASLELCLLAEGKVDLYFEIRLQPWDVAAGAIIIKEAGGVFGSVFSSKTVCLDKPYLYVAANNKQNYDKVKQIVLSVMPKIPYND